MQLAAFKLITRPSRLRFGTQVGKRTQRIFLYVQIYSILVNNSGSGTLPCYYQRVRYLFISGGTDVPDLDVNA